LFAWPVATLITQPGHARSRTAPTPSRFRQWAGLHVQPFLNFGENEMTKTETLKHQNALSDASICPHRLENEKKQLLGALEWAHSEVLKLARERDPDQLGMWDAIFNGGGPVRDAKAAASAKRDRS
jgi:hypothetical protein